MGARYQEGRHLRRLASAAGPAAVYEQRETEVSLCYLPFLKNSNVIVG